MASKILLSIKKKGIFFIVWAANEISPREKLALTQLMPYAWAAILQKN